VKLYTFQDENKLEVGCTSPFIELYETKPMSFQLESETALISPFLIMGNMKIELILNDSIDEEFIYTAKPSNYFINNVGLALIELVDDEDNDYEQLGSINVLSSKITIDRLYSMLKYISEVDSRLVHCCFSKTFLSADGGKFEYTDLYFKLLHTEKTLEYLWENRNKFKNQPCKRIKTNQVVKEFSPKDLMDDRAYSWLLSNLNELEFTINPESTLISHYGKSLTAKHIATSVIEDDKDIFENQVIYTFLIATKRFIESIHLEENYYKKVQTAKTEFTDIVPFIQSFVSDKLNIKTQLISRISGLVDNCLKFITLNFTKTYVANLRPKITQYVSRHNHYLMLYRLMDNWWNIDASNLIESDSVNQLLYSIKSMDKLYELFVLLKLIEALNEHDCKMVDLEFVDFDTFPSLGIDNKQEKAPYEVFNFYQFDSANLDIKLYLEPTIYPYREGIENNELFIIDKSPDNRPAKKLSRAKHIRTPDYVLEIYQKDTNRKYVFILDAKYSSYETVLYERLPSKGRSKEQKSKSGLVDKYLHGIKVYHHEGAKMVDGLFATFISGFPTKSKNKAILGIADTFALDGEFPLAPFVDLIKFSPEEDKSMGEHKVFISNILDYVSNKSTKL
jgi:hypothetical protein